MQSNISMNKNNILIILKYKVKKTKIIISQQLQIKKVLTQTIHGKKREIKLLLKCPIMQKIAIIVNTCLYVGGGGGTGIPPINTL